MKTCRGCKSDEPDYFVTSSGYCWDCWLAHLHGRRQGIDARTLGRIDRRRDLTAEIPALTPDLLSRLTAKQREIAPLMWAGMSVAAIVRRTGRARRSVEEMAVRIRERLDVKNPPYLIGCDKVA